MKQFFLVLVGVVVLILVFAIFLFWMASRPKFKDVSNQKPFVEVVKKRIATKRKALIMKYPGNPIDEKYNMVLEDGTGFGLEADLPTYATLPIGTEVHIDKVELHTGRVSGTTTAYLFGRVYSEATAQEYLFQYSWGYYHSLQEDNPYWTFDTAFWQEEALEGKYYIEVP